MSQAREIDSIGVLYPQSVIYKIWFRYHRYVESYSGMSVFSLKKGTFSTLDENLTMMPIG